MDSGLDRIAKPLGKWIEEYPRSAFSDTVIEEASNPKNCVGSPSEMHMKSCVGGVDPAP